MTLDALGQDAEVNLMRAIAPHLQFNNFVDVGAERGAIAQALFSCSLQGVLFEPLPRHFRALQTWVDPRRGAVFPWAISDADGDRDLFVATDAAGDELDHFHSLQPARQEGVFQHEEKIQVRCRSLDSLSRDGILPKEIGLLKTDTEGNDLNVLRGLGGLRPELVVCEYFTDGLYEGWRDGDPELAIRQMRELGYSKYVAFKHYNGLDLCVSGPCAFVPNQWGNLFFFSEELFARTRNEIADTMQHFERKLVSDWDHINADRVAKESVIRELLERQATGVANNGGVPPGLSAD
jgi:FkbM family methyltransferase